MNHDSSWLDASGASLRLIIYALFVCVGVLRFSDAPGDDLSASFVACHLISSGATENLYDHDSEYFHIVDTPAWNNAAQQAGFDGFLHPYVQTPLWAWVLQPVCSSLDYDAFKIAFLVSALLALVASVEVVARNWSNYFLRPWPVALLLFAVALTTPFRYAMWLVQTHVLFLLLMLLAVFLASNRRSFLAGVLLAVAAAVKITPGFLVIYWMVTGRWRAVGWFGLSSALLALLTIAAVGVAPLRDFIETLARIGDVLLVSFNNQSLAAWLGSLTADPVEVGNWRMHSLPPALKLSGSLLPIASVILAGLMARRSGDDAIPIAFALAGLTIFAPIAWTHYYIVLIPGIMLLVQKGAPASLAIPLIVLCLNIPPVALDPINPALGQFTLIRSHALSGLVLMIALFLKVIVTSPDRSLKTENEVGQAAES